MYVPISYLVSNYNSIYLSRNLLLLSALEMVIFRIIQSLEDFKIDARLKESKVRILWIHASLNPQTVSYCFNGWRQLFTHSVEGEALVLFLLSKLDILPCLANLINKSVFIDLIKRIIRIAKFEPYIRTTHILTKLF